MVIIQYGKDLDPESLNGIYKEIAQHFGLETAFVMHYHFKGLQISFPQRLLSKEYVRERIAQEYNGKNVRDLARKYGYTERVIRDWLAEGRDNAQEIGSRNDAISGIPFDSNSDLEGS